MKVFSFPVAGGDVLVSLHQVAEPAAALRPLLQTDREAAVVLQVLGIREPAFLVGHDVDPLVDGLVAFFAGQLLEVVRRVGRGEGALGFGGSAGGRRLRILGFCLLGCGRCHLWLGALGLRCGFLGRRCLRLGALGLRCAFLGRRRSALCLGLGAGQLQLLADAQLLGILQSVELGGFLDQLVQVALGHAWIGVLEDLAQRLALLDLVRRGARGGGRFAFSLDPLEGALDHVLEAGQEAFLLLFLSGRAEPSAPWPWGWNRPSHKNRPWAGRQASPWIRRPSSVRRPSYLDHFGGAAGVAVVLGGGFETSLNCQVSYS